MFYWILTKSHDKGDLDFGTTRSSAMLASVLAMFAAVEVIQERNALLMSRKTRAADPELSA